MKTACYAAGFLLVATVAVALFVFAVRGGYDNPVLFTWRTPAVTLTAATGFALIVVAAALERRVRGSWQDIAGWLVFLTLAPMGFLGFLEWSEGSTLEADSLLAWGGLAGTVAFAPYLLYSAWRYPERMVWLRGAATPLNVWGRCVVSIVFCGASVGFAAIAFNRWAFAGEPETRPYSVADKRTSEARTPVHRVILIDEGGNVVVHSFACASCANRLVPGATVPFTVRRGILGREFFTAYGPGA